MKKCFDITYTVSGEEKRVSFSAFDVQSALLEFHADQQLNLRHERKDYQLISVKSDRGVTWGREELNANPDIFKCRSPKAAEKRHRSALDKGGYIFSDDRKA